MASTTPMSQEGQRLKTMNYRDTRHAGSTWANKPLDSFTRPRIRLLGTANGEELEMTESTPKMQGQDGNQLRQNNPKRGLSYRIRFVQLVTVIAESKVQRFNMPSCPRVGVLPESERHVIKEAKPARGRDMGGGSVDA